MYVEKKSVKQHRINRQFSLYKLRHMTIS